MADNVLKIEFQPNPIQRAFIESRAEADLFSSRMGEGKSAGLCWAIYYHTRHNPGARWALIRDTWENLQATTLQEFFKWFPPGIFGTFNASHKEWKWAEGIAQGTIQFLGMDDPNDASKLQSRELAGFAIDEPAPAQGSAGVAELVFDIALSRLRQPGINWYTAKLAQNNPDESHWTYRRFVLPGTPGFRTFQTREPENVRNLPPNYYANLRKNWAHRPDLVNRFVEGNYGFQQIGKSVTPEWSDDIHLGVGLVPVRNAPLTLLWDFGLNPTCIITQVTPMRSWNVLDAFVGEEMGIEELCEAVVAPTLTGKYADFARPGAIGWTHIGDPAGMNREQSSAQQSAVRMLVRKLGGKFRPGPQKPLSARVDPLKAVLRQTVAGRGLIQVDRDAAKAVWYSLRGGWHYHVARTGIQSAEPAKDIHSHPGDAMGYGAAVLFPLSKIHTPRRGPSSPLPRASAWTTPGTEPQLGGKPRRPAPPREGRLLPPG